jgi:hypothetical protein
MSHLKICHFLIELKNLHASTFQYSQLNDYLGIQIRIYLVILGG